MVSGPVSWRRNPAREYLLSAPPDDTRIKWSQSRNERSVISRAFNGEESSMEIKRDISMTRRYSILQQDDSILFKDTRKTEQKLSRECTENSLDYITKRSSPGDSRRNPPYFQSRTSRLSTEAAALCSSAVLRGIASVQCNMHRAAWTLVCVSDGLVLHKLDLWFCYTCTCVN